MNPPTVLPVNDKINYWLTGYSALRGVNKVSGNWEAQKERSNPFTLKFICWIALHISRPVTRLWLYPITLYFLITSPKVRFASRHYLKKIPGLNGNLWQIAKHIYWFSATVLDRVYFITDQHQQFDITVHNQESLNDYIDRKQGCILLGAHIGSFEVLRCLAINRNQLQLKILMYQEHNAMITRILEDLNPRIAESVINLADERAMFLVSEELEAGGLVGVLGDRATKKDKKITCPFLGDDAVFPTGPLALSEVLNAPVILFFGLYEGGNRYTIYHEILTDGKPAGRKQREKVVKKNVARYVSRMEHYVKLSPYNWFNFYDFWQQEIDD